MNKKLKVPNGDMNKLAKKTGSKQMPVKKKAPKC